MNNKPIQLALRALDDPDRLTDLTSSFQDHVANLLAEANDAGYSDEEAVMSLFGVVKDATEGRRRSDSAQPPKDSAGREDVVAKSALDM